LRNPAYKLNSENEGLYTAPDLAFALPPAASSGYFLRDPISLTPEDAGVALSSSLSTMEGNISEKAIFQKKLVFQRAHAIGTFGVR
jgi:hypothetical protein